MESLARLNPKKIAAGVFVGSVVGGIWQVGAQLAKMHIKPTQELDPPCPNMEAVDSFLSDQFRTFMGPYYKLCPDEHKTSFKKLVREALFHAEAVMLIVVQLRKGEIAKSIKERQEAAAHRSICLDRLRKTNDLFRSQISMQVKDTIDIISYVLSEQLNNIYVLTTP